VWFKYYKGYPCYIDPREEAKMMKIYKQNLRSIKFEVGEKTRLNEILNMVDMALVGHFPGRRNNNSLKNGPKKILNLQYEASLEV
jgi:hypothetical protein